MNIKFKRGQLTNLSSEVFEHSGEVDGRTGADTLGVAAFSEEASDSADGELEAGFERSGNGLCAPGLASAAGGCGWCCRVHGGGNGFVIGKFGNRV